MIVRCHDCMDLFDDKNGLFIKCHFCRERDQNYVERAKMEKVPFLNEGLGEEA